MVTPLSYHSGSPASNQTTPRPPMNPATTPSSMAQSSTTTTLCSTPNLTTTVSTIGAPQATTERVASSAEAAQAQSAEGWAMIRPEASEAGKEKGMGKRSRTKKTDGKKKAPTMQAAISYHLREIVTIAAAHKLDFNQLIDPFSQTVKSEPDDSYDADSYETAMETEASEAGHNSQDEGWIGSFCQIHLWSDN